MGIHTFSKGNSLKVNVWFELVSLFDYGTTEVVLFSPKQEDNLSYFPKSISAKMNVKAQLKSELAH